MKRSEMLSHIEDDLLTLTRHRWIERGETEKWANWTANQILDMIEGFGMHPPDAELDKCSDPVFQIHISNVDVPHWKVLGWDDE